MRLNYSKGAGLIPIDPVRSSLAKVSLETRAFEARARLRTGLTPFDTS